MSINIKQHTHYYEFCVLQFFPGPKNHTNRGPPVIMMVVHKEFYDATEK